MKNCIMCGCILDDKYDDEICPCCLDDMYESDPGEEVESLYPHIPIGYGGTHLIKPKFDEDTVNKYKDKSIWDMFPPGYEGLAHITTSNKEVNRC